MNLANSASIGIGNINTGSIGKYVSNGTVYSLSDLGSGKAAAANTGDTALAQNIVNQAIKDVAGTRGRLGAFQSNVIGSTINSLNVALENVSSSESAIQDTDFATETANLTRNQTSCRPRPRCCLRQIPLPSRSSSCWVNSNTDLSPGSLGAGSLREPTPGGPHGNMRAAVFIFASWLTHETREGGGGVVQFAA